MIVTRINPFLNGFPFLQRSLSLICKSGKLSRFSGKITSEIGGSLVQIVNTLDCIFSEDYF
jgi:hypothetical protein